ncbi:DUF6262 family protein [Isoptericola halotolerans]|uniref:DUF6262 family protein n=1 Tax=Isoptericola halotolerans TaxID=300560 RepID=UPI00388FAFF9
MRADNTRHLVAAAEQRAADARARAEWALTDLQRAGRPISVSGLARAAEVSRSWLYTQPRLLEQLEDQNTSARAAARVTGVRASDSSLRRRLELAHQRVRQLTEENVRLREQLGRAHGQIREARYVGGGPEPEQHPASSPATGAVSGPAGGPSCDQSIEPRSDPTVG